MRLSRPAPRRSRAWGLAWRASYRFLRIIGPLLRLAWLTGGLGITARLAIRGGRSGRPRSVLVGLLRVNGEWYVGHPNGNAGWTRNLATAGSAELKLWRSSGITVRAARLPDGPEREAVIRATADQQPFPGNLLYRAARGHIMAVGVYFRLTPTDPSAIAVRAA